MWRWVLFILVPWVVAADDAPAVYQAQEHFTNAIGGRLTVISDAQPTTLTSADEIRFTLKLTGVRNPDRVRFPNLAERPDWQKLFRHISPAAVSLTTTDGVTAEYRLRPRTIGTFQLPSIRLDYFVPDAPADRAVRTKYTEAVPFTVADGPTTTGPPGPTAEVVIPPPVEPSGPSVGAWLALVGGLCGGLAGWLVWWQHRNPGGQRMAEVRRNRAVRTVLDRLEADDPTATEVSVALRGYLIQRHGLPTSATVPAEIETAASALGLPSHRVKAVVDLLRRCDARFSSRSESQPLAAVARSLVLSWEGLT